MSEFFHPDNKGKPWVDWRLPENRKEMFFRWLNWRLVGRNIDHYAWNQAYMNTSKSPTGAPMTRPEKLWYSYLFGTTYQSSLAWVFYWHFPDYQNVDMEKLDAWNRATMPRQKFATDTRYNKGHVVRMWTSFLDWVDKTGQGDIERAFDSLLEEDQVKSFHQVTENIRSLHKFGRMTGWLFAQCLYECADLPIAPDTMFTDDPSNVSVWNGMCYLIGREDMTVGKPPKFAGYTPTKADRVRFRNLEVDLMNQAREEVGDDPFLSYFTLETHLCQFKKLNVGGDYPGQNVGDAVNRYHDFKRLWPEVDFSAFSDVVDSEVMLDAIRWHRESKALMKLFSKTGQPINMHDMYPDLPDMWKELGLSPDILRTEGAEFRIGGSVAEYARRISPEPRPPDVFSMFSS